MTKLSMTAGMAKILGRKPATQTRTPAVHVIQDVPAGVTLGATWGLPDHVPAASLDAFARGDRMEAHQAAEAHAAAVAKAEDTAIQEMRRDPEKDRTLAGILHAASVAMDRDAAVAQYREQKAFREWREKNL